MQNLKLIENELVPVYETSTGEKVVSGRELHQVLQSGQDFSTWVKKRLAECDAEENKDFDRFHKKMEANNATIIEYIIKLDIAKEMAMLERNEKGKQVRRYFIQVEKKYKTSHEDLLNLQNMSVELQAIIMHDRKIQQVEHKVESVNQDLQDFKMDMPILGIEIDKITAAVKKKGIECLGGKESNAYKNKSLRGKLYHDIYRELKRQFDVSTYKAIKRNQCDVAIELIQQYKPPYTLAGLIETENAQMNMEVA